ncbi:MAG: hypothetical protein JWO07_842 [Candidatus Saccharibacteria bacterium]|nr:hypothetical protein [Candidatus Saccharibacteria bacterium]
MVWPAAGIILSIALYAIFNFILGSIEPANASDITAPVSPLRAGLNILLFLVGAASAGLGPISFIVGLVLLVSRKK